MNWTIEFDANAAKEYKKLSADTKRIILDYLQNKVLKNNHPKDLGKLLKYDYLGLWRYRVDKYRIICHIEEKKFVILVLKIGKRDNVYKT